MKRLALILLSSACLIAHAGSAPEGESSVNGFFLGFETEAFFSVSQPKEFLDQIQRTCKSGRKVWALGVASPFICTHFSFIEEGGNGPVYGVKLTNKKTIKARTHALLFSVRPFPKPVWTVRAPTIADIDELSSKTALRDKTYATALKHLKAGRGKVIEPSNGKAQIYLVPGRVTNDGIVEVKSTLLITKFGNAYEVTEFQGEVVGLADLNDDGIPELQISTSCDGTCESVWSVVRQAPVRLGISNH